MTSPPAASPLVPILYIDAVAGASGDMFLGALVDLGADFDALRAGLATLPVKGFDLTRSATTRQSIAGTKVDVHVEDNQPHRRLPDLIAILETSKLSEAVRQRAARILTRLAEAEAAVHRMPIENVHLHEVGGLDCLVDIAGTCLALELLGVTRIYGGPVALGTGTIACAHGKMPEPAPATMALLEGYPVRKTSINGEMTTPTGAAIISALAVGFMAPLVMIPRRVGYGAGTRQKREIANLLRLVLADVDPRLLPEHYHASRIAAVREPIAAPPDHDHGHGHDHDHDHGHSHDHGHTHAHGA